MAKRRNFTPEFKAEVVLEALRGESSQAELCRRHNLSEQQLSKWKQQVVEAARWAVDRGVRHSKKSIDFLELTPSQACEIGEALDSDYSVRQICEVLGFTRSNFYYHPKEDPYEHLLRDEIEKLAAQYPTYGYRRITHLLVKAGYPVGYRRVARLMKTENFCVSVKRVCRTTTSLPAPQSYVNRLQTVSVSRRDQVWVGDITYVRLNRRFIYVAVLMDVFTRMIRGWHLSQHLNQSLTLQPLQEALLQNVAEIHHSDQDVQYLSSAYISVLKHHGIEISIARRGCPWKNGYAERLIRTLKEEEVHLNDYEDIIEARQRIGQFITQVYHQKRPHSALGYLTPIEFQEKNLS